MARGILSGELPAGTRIPSSRRLSKDLAVSRNAVLLAYDQLLAEGYLDSAVGSGTFVAANLPDDGLPKSRQRPSSDPAASPHAVSRAAVAAQAAFAQAVGFRGQAPTYDFQYGVPNVLDFPHELWRRLLISAARRRSAKILAYAHPSGVPELREAVARYVRQARAVACSAENILIVNGSQQALDLVARTLCDPGDRVVIENPHYSGARNAFSVAGASLVPVPVDRGGLSVETGEQIVSDAKLIYVTPSHQFPTGAIMPLARRIALLNWAEALGAYVVEDDYDSEFRYLGRPIEAVQALDTKGRVIYVGTLSKTMFPSFRMGYMVLPTALVEAFCAMKYVNDRHSAILQQQALAMFLSEGHFERHVRRSRVRNAARREALIASLRRHFGDRVQIADENSGLHLLVWFPDLTAQETPALAQAAEKLGVGVYSVAPYFIGDPGGCGLVLGYAALEPPGIDAGIALLRRGWDRVTTQ
ncbi:MocR-like pyridoxine biosynthesis transcription factor PdxR [Xanthobacter dioxanivorans]|uniref:MocR-like pyridoxine biosynthesis transcription factor PdxR n=1 Tax=Xanthobacter dioxanivorans TaxID=2528964 RepID=UPI002FD6C55E